MNFTFLWALPSSNSAYHYWTLPLCILCSFQRKALYSASCTVHQLVKYECPKAGCALNTMNANLLRRRASAQNFSIGFDPLYHMMARQLSHNFFPLAPSSCGNSRRADAPKNSYIRINADIKFLTGWLILKRREKIPHPRGFKGASHFCGLCMRNTSMENITHVMSCSPAAHYYQRAGHAAN